MAPGKPYRDVDTLAHMLDAAEIIEGFCRGLTYEEFEADINVFPTTAYLIHSTT